MSVDVIAELVAGLGPLWHDRHQASLVARPWKRAAGAGAKHRLVFIDRLLATLGAPPPWGSPRRAGLLVRRRPIDHHPGHRRSPASTGRARMHHLPGTSPADTRRGHRPPRLQRADRNHRRTEIRVRRPAIGRKDRDKYISGKNKQNAVKAMVLTHEKGRMLLCSPAEPASCADITHPRRLGLVKHLVAGPAVEILADAGYQALGAQTGGRVVTPPHPQVQEEPAGPVRGDLRAAATGPFLTPYPSRARDRTPSTRTAITETHAAE